MTPELERIDEIVERNARTQSNAARDVALIARIARDAIRRSIDDAIADAEHAALRSRFTAQQAQATIDRLRARVAALETEQRERARLTHDQANEGDEVRIKFGARDWDVAMLEQAAYRLRLAGAHDYTPVQVAASSISSVVPNPCIVNLDLARGTDIDFNDFAHQVEAPRFGAQAHLDLRIASILVITVVVLVAAVITAGVIL